MDVFLPLVSCQNIHVCIFSFWTIPNRFSHGWLQICGWLKNSRVVTIFVGDLYNLKWGYWLYLTFILNLRVSVRAQLCFFFHPDSRHVPLLITVIYIFSWFSSPPLLWSSIVSTFHRFSPSLSLSLPSCIFLTATPPVLWLCWEGMNISCVGKWYVSLTLCNQSVSSPSYLLHLPLIWSPWQRLSLSHGRTFDAVMEVGRWEDPEIPRTCWNHKRHQ